MIYRGLRPPPVAGCIARLMMAKKGRNGRNTMDLSVGTLLIFSGEGDEGTWERYEGARTPRAIRSRLSRERCHGDRWASAWIEEPSMEDQGYPGVPVYVELDRGLYGTTGKMRAVPADQIRINPAAQLRAGKTNPASAENGKRGGRPKKSPPAGQL